MPPSARPSRYRGRLAPTPSGLLHSGHAATFWTAYQRCLLHNGELIMRMDDIDADRCHPEFMTAAMEDLRWLGIQWQEGPDCAGPFGPYLQSERFARYVEAFEHLRSEGLVYPCQCTRRDVARALSAPHAVDEEPIYPGTCRPSSLVPSASPRAGVNWRLRILNPETVQFVDAAKGIQSAVALRDFGDFLVWRKDDLPAYQLASVVDDIQMGVTEVVRGEDLITSTFRQILLWRAFSQTPPNFYHCSLIRDEGGARLAKRDNARSIRTFREEGFTPSEIFRTIAAM